MKFFAAASFILLASFFTVNSVVQAVGQELPVGGIEAHMPPLTNPRQNNNSPPPRLGPTPEPRVVTKGKLAPALADRIVYADFLKETGTGLVRLLPQPTPEQPTQRPKMSSGRERYSFSFHSHNSVADIALTFDVICQGVTGGPPLCQYPRKLSAGHFGMLTNLGDVAMDQISVFDPRAVFLLAYVPPREGPKARCELLEFHKGVTINGQLYKTGLPIQVNSTYLLRATDRRSSDVLVAFRVVREDVDGSVTLAWKLLNEFKPTKIENVLYVNNTDRCPAN